MRLEAPDARGWFEGLARVLSAGAEAEEALAALGGDRVGAVRYDGAGGGGPRDPMDAVDAAMDSVPELLRRVGAAERARAAARAALYGEGGLASRAGALRCDSAWMRWGCLMTWPDVAAAMGPDATPSWAAGLAASLCRWVDSHGGAAAWLP